MTDDTREPDPAEVELVAYLDGELDAAAAARVEARIAADPAYRTRADALRRPFDLLDFLPKPEASPTFATRTLAQTQRVEPVTSASTHGRRRWAFAAGSLLAAGVALVAGYLGAAAVRPAAPVPVASAEPLSLADLRVVENLPLLAVADDVAFLDRLAAPDLFGDEAADPTPGPAPPPAKPAGPALDALATAFRDLPPDQRDRVRRLDHDLAELPAGRRDRLSRVLECYAAWLDRLPPADRAAVLSATPEARVGAVRTARRAQWVAALPSVRRAALDKLPAAEREPTLWLWREEDDRRRERWADAGLQWEAARLGRTGPFEADAFRRQVAAFARAAYRPDDPARPCRLSSLEQTRLRDALKQAEEGNDWAPLGRAVYTLSQKYEMLPEPGNGKPVLDFPDLWPAARRYFEVRTKPKERLAAAVGRWPEFALRVWEEAEKPKGIEVPPNFALGPGRPGQYNDEVRRLLPALREKATPDEWKGLVALEGKWPAHSRELIRLAKAHDLGVPGALPPGPPSLWDKTFGPARPKK